jgi:hypothetical protein
MFSSQTLTCTNVIIQEDSVLWRVALTALDMRCFKTDRTCQGTSETSCTFSTWVGRCGLHCGGSSGEWKFGLTGNSIHFVDKKGDYQIFIHSSVICQTTGPQPLPKRFLHLMRSRASSFK